MKWRIDETTTQARSEGVDGEVVFELTSSYETEYWYDYPIAWWINLRNVFLPILLGWKVTAPLVEAWLMRDEVYVLQMAMTQEKADQLNQSEEIEHGS